MHHPTETGTASGRPGYAVGYLTDVVVNDELLEYMAKVESTMARFGGRWLVHGTTPDVREGKATGDIVIIGFPDLEQARAWYESPEYQEIIRLRSRNATSSIALLEGVRPGYTTHETISALRASLTPGQTRSRTVFVPPGFQPPRALATEQFRLEPLGPQHNEADLRAWTSSIDHIRSTPGYPDGSWPPEAGMSLERNLRDMRRHAQDFADHKGFTFTVLDTTDEDVIGCVYLYPSPAPEHDVVAQSWVRSDRAHLDVVLARAVSRWIAEDWPWERVDYLGR